MHIMSLVQMRTIVMALTAAVMTILVVSVVTVSKTFAVIDNNNNNNTDASGGAVGNDNSSVVTEDGSSGNGENAKSGINTTVCGPDAAMRAKHHHLLMDNSII